VAVRVTNKLPWRFSDLVFPFDDLDLPVADGSSVWSNPEHPALTTRISWSERGSRADLLTRKRKNDKEHKRFRNP
jgi:hypothetical protein